MLMEPPPHPLHVDRRVKKIAGNLMHLCHKIKTNTHTNFSDAILLIQKRFGPVEHMSDFSTFHYYTLHG